MNFLVFVVVCCVHFIWLETNNFKEPQVSLIFWLLLTQDDMGSWELHATLVEFLSFTSHKSPTPLALGNS